MRDYTKIAPQFWTGETGRKIRRLGPEAVAIALYLLTCPHANAFGMYYLPLGYMACDVGMSPEGASEWLQKVCATGFCAYDEDAEVVWVRNMARFQIGEEVNPKDNRAKWIISEWLHLPKNVFLHDFYDVYVECFGLPSLSDERGFCNPSEASSKPRARERARKRRKYKYRIGTAFGVTRCVAHSCSFACRRGRSVAGAGSTLTGLASGTADRATVTLTGFAGGQQARQWQERPAARR